MLYSLYIKHKSGLDTIYLHTIEHSDSGQVIDICRYKIQFKYLALDILFRVRCDL